MEIFRSLGALVESPDSDGQPLADALDLGPLPAPSEHADLFLFELFPYASVYLGPEGKMGGEARDRVAGFWRVLGETPPAEPDHLTVLLAAYAELCERASELDSGGPDSPWQRARRVFLWEHLLSWLSLFLGKLCVRPRDSFYVRWGELSAALLAEELDASGLSSDPIFEAPPAALDASLALPDPRQAGAEAFLDGLCAPARTGFILTGNDLRRVAQGLGLAPRAGERRFVLKGLLAHDAPGVLKRIGNLAAEVEPDRRWGPIGDLWQRRRDRTVELLRDLERDVPEL